MGELEAVLNHPAEAGPRRRRRRLDLDLLLVAPAGVLLLVCFGYPVLELLARSVLEPTAGLDNYRRLVEQPLFVRVLWNTVSISFTVAAFCLLIGYPVAYTMASAGPRLRRLLIFHHPGAVLDQHPGAQLRLDGAAAEERLDQRHAAEPRVAE